MGATEKNGPIVHPEPRVTIVTYIGHSTLLLETNGVRLLTDLVLRDHVAFLVRHSLPVPSAWRHTETSLGKSPYPSNNDELTSQLYNSLPYNQAAEIKSSCLSTICGEG